MDRLSVFISWSGERSHAVAKQIKAWLPDVVRNAEPWLSSEDLRKGLQWLPELNKNLTATGFGLLVVTAENKTAPWMLFEAGVISKALPDKHCCPILCDLKQTDVSGPLTQFQSTAITKKDDMFLLVKTMNETSGAEKVDEERLTKWFNRSWEDFDRDLTQILATKGPAATAALRPGPSQQELLEEVLATVRRLAIEPRSRFDEMMMRELAGPLHVPPEILLREFSALSPPFQERFFELLRRIRHEPESIEELMHWLRRAGRRGRIDRPPDEPPKPQS